MKYEEISKGQSEVYAREITLKDVLNFALLSGDTNNVHLGDQGIVHGMLIMSYISMIIGTKLPGNGSIWSSSDIRFIQPIFIGDQIVITTTVIKKNDISKCINLRTDVVTKRGLCVATSNWVYIH